MIFYSIAKRTFDVFFSVLFLLVFSPIYVFTILIIKIVSSGNAIFVAKRVGKDGRVFNCYKFRSMRMDSGKVHLTTLQNDDRIFPFGKFIRTAKIDEFPQALNVLLGQMTVVGPRPEDQENADIIFIGDYKHIMDVKPGLTSPASLYDYTHGELYEDETLYEKEFLPKKLALELYYVRHQSLSYDFKTILMTVWIVIQRIFGKRKFDEPEELEYIGEE